MNLEMRQMFNCAQHLHKHQKCYQIMNSLHKQYSKSDEFKSEIIRNIRFTLECEPKSVFTKHVIEFVSNILRSFSSTNDSVLNTTQTNGKEEDHNVSDEENCSPIDSQILNTSSVDEIGLQSLGSEEFCSQNTSYETTLEPNLTDIIIKELLINYLYSLNTKCRYNTCVLIRKLFSDLEDIDCDVYNRLKRALLDRLADKEKVIRSVAALALHRFQEVDDRKDLVMTALKFHLKNDPDFYVRQSCLQSLHPANHTTDEFINATKDVKDIIRKTAFKLIAEKFEIKSFDIDKRLQLLKNGLNERNPSVKLTVQTKLIPNWVKTFDGNLVSLLFALDIQSDPDLIEKMLFLYFNHILKDNDDNGITEFHKLLDKFRDEFLDEFNLLTKEELTVEKAFLWRIISKFCKENNITITVINSSDVDIDEDEQQSNQINEEKMDAIDTILPDLPHYCSYLEFFVKQTLENEHEVQELMEYEFMFNELLIMGQLLEVGDEAQRQILRKYLTEILENEKLFDKLTDYIPNVMKIFSLNFDSNILSEITVNVIDSIINSNNMEIDEQTNKMVSQESHTNRIVINSEQLRQFEVKYAQISVQIQKLRDELDSAVSNNDFREAQRVKDIIDELNKEKNDIMDKRLNINSSLITQSSQTSQLTQNNENKAQIPVSDMPLVLERCDLIFSGCLEFGKFKEINSILLTLIERLVIPSITCLDISIRSLGVKCLGLSSLLSYDLAQKYFTLFLQIFNFDSEKAQQNALKSIFDFLCIHGLSAFENKTEEKQNESHFSDDNKENRSDNSQHIGEEDNENTIIMDEYNSESEERTLFVTEEEDDQSFTELFTDLLLKHLYSESDSIRLIVVKGIAKLFILGRMFSPQILSKLIILWYEIDSSDELRQFLGIFLPIYSGIEMKSNLKGQNAFEECFILTVETVYNESICYVNMDNMINFLIELISDDGHQKLALSIANRILTLTVENELSTKYYLKVLTALRFNEMSTQNVKEFRLLFKKIEKLYKNMSGVTKLIQNRVKTIKSKITKQIELIKHNSSQVTTIEDFGSQSSQTSNISHIEKTLNSEETFLNNDETILSNDETIVYYNSPQMNQ